MNKSETLARDIREKIRKGDYPEGYRLPSIREEHEERSGLAPATIRGVYLKLCDEGLLSMSRSAGTVVRKKANTQRFLVPGHSGVEWMVHQELPPVLDQAHSWIYEILEAPHGHDLWNRTRVIGPVGQDPWCIETVWSTSLDTAPMHPPMLPGGLSLARVTNPSDEERALLDGINPMPFMLLASSDYAGDEVVVWKVPGDRIELQF